MRDTEARRRIEFLRESVDDNQKFTDKQLQYIDLKLTALAKALGFEIVNVKEHYEVAPRPADGK